MKIKYLPIILLLLTMSLKAISQEIYPKPKHYYCYTTVDSIIIEVGQPISHRIDHMLSGTRSNIAIKLFGYDLKEMYNIAKDIQSRVNGVEGIADLNVEQQVEIPQIKISPKRNMLARYGIPVKEFIEFVDIAFGGHKVTDVFEEERSFDMVLRFDDENRNDLNAIRNVTMTTYQGKKYHCIISQILNLLQAQTPSAGKM